MNPLGSSKEIVQNKLIILYIIHRLNIPVSNIHITKMVLQTRLMNYFVFQQCFNELLDGGLIVLGGSEAAAAGKDISDRDKDTSAAASSNPVSDKGHGSRYILSETGQNTLQYFMNLIPPGIKKQLDNATSSVRKKIREETLVTADYIPESEEKFTVVCGIREDDFTLIDLNVAVGTKKDARSICENWKRHSSEIYAEIIEALTKNRD
jgi:hypothetical protein